MKIVSVAEMVAMEQATAAAGFGYDQMMAAAGAALADALLALPRAAGPILFLIGPGNNGGDGLVACARLQAHGLDAIPYLWQRRQEEDALVAAVRQPLWADADPGHTHLAALTAAAAVIVDALLGTGVTRPIGGSLAALLARVHAALADRAAISPALIDPTRPQPRPRPWIVACDCPSGLVCDTGALDPLALAADLTVTFALPKRGHFLQPGAAACGRLCIADIHIARALAPAPAPDLLTPDEIAALLPARPAAAHKGSFGKALIVAGSRQYPGAAALSSAAAYRAGAGLVHLAAAAGVGQIVAGQTPEPVHTLLPADLGALTPDALPLLQPLCADHDALLVGPGLGLDRLTVAFVEGLLVGRAPARRGYGFAAGAAAPAPERPALPPRVVDADALNALAQIDQGPARLPVGSILTPHPGEMARLCGLSVAAINQDRWGVAARFARAWEQIIVLKGAHTVIAHPDGPLAISPFAQPALATAGSGDVLAGAIVGLLAQGLPPWDAARGGVYVHALAGSLAAAALGPALLASDISRHLPQALARLAASRGDAAGKAFSPASPLP